jgi:hypothetical protein
MSKPTLPELDSSLYPQFWEQQIFNDPQALLVAMLKGRITPDPQAFTKQILANDVYQEWINFTVFGRYIQRNFAAFYQQSEDSFNMDMPALFRHELRRYGQYLPFGQILFVAGQIPESARREKLFTTTVNPATAVMRAQTINQSVNKSTNKSALTGSQDLIVNHIRVKSKQVLGFAIRHNKRTSERTRNEVLILDFNDLRLVDEQIVGDNISGNKASNEEGSNTATLPNVESAVLLRYYELR